MFRKPDHLATVKPPATDPKPTQIPGGPLRPVSIINLRPTSIDWGCRCDGCGKRETLYSHRENGALRALCVLCHPTAAKSAEGK